MDLHSTHSMRSMQCSVSQTTLKKGQLAEQSMLDELCTKCNAPNHTSDQQDSEISGFVLHQQQLVPHCAKGCQATSASNSRCVLCGGVGRQSCVSASAARQRLSFGKRIGDCVDLHGPTHHPTQRA